MTKQLAVVTPSYAPDAGLFADLHRSVLEHSSDDTIHHVVVPQADRGKFARFEGSRCRIWSYPELLPSRFRPLPSGGWWVNLRRPWPPIRGWVLQQAMKIALTGELDVDAVLLADSDVVFVRPIDPARFVQEDGRMPLYRLAGAVHPEMQRHVIWHRVAHRLLGLTDIPNPPLHDYVSPLNVWSPATVRAMQRRIQRITGRPWIDAVTTELHVSEFILYGVFVDRVLSAGGSCPASDTTFCHDYWDRTPMDQSSAADFASRMPANAIAMMISAKSDTARDIRLAAARWREE